MKPGKTAKGDVSLLAVFGILFVQMYIQLVERYLDIVLDEFFIDGFHEPPFGGPEVS